MNTIDKKTIEKELKSLYKRRRVFTILGFSFLGVGGVLLFLSIYFSSIKINDVVDLINSLVIMPLSNLLVTASLVMFILRSVLFNRQIAIRQMLLIDPSAVNVFNAKGENVEIKDTVDVKEAPKSHNQELLEQYENLYKQGYISQEDLDKKKEELKD